MESRTTSHEWSDPDGRPWTVTLTWRGNECVGVAIEAATTGPANRITAALVRMVPVGAKMKEARQGMAIKPGASGGAAPPSTTTGSERKKPDGHYYEVANVYFWAWVRDAPPLEAIRAHFQVSHSTAARWVREARKRTILGPAEHGRAGGYPRWIDAEEDVKDPGYTWSYYQKEDK